MALQFQKLSKEAVCELLSFLQENEEFSSLKSLKGISKQDVRGVLEEIVTQLQKELIEEMPAQKPNYSDHSLSSDAMSLISCLSPREEMLLFKSFKLL